MSNRSSESSAAAEDEKDLSPAADEDLNSVSISCNKEVCMKTRV